MTITVNKLHNGALELSTVHYNHRVSRTYYWYSKRAALADFRAYVRSL